MAETVYEMLIRHEGLRLQPYRCSEGKLTIGVGHNLDDNGISEDIAMTMLEEDVEACMDALHTFEWFHRLNTVRKNAMIDMMFNLGLPRFSGFRRMIMAMEAGDYVEAASEARDSLWYKQVGSRAEEVCKMIKDGR